MENTSKPYDATVVPWRKLKTCKTCGHLAKDVYIIYILSKIIYIHSIKTSGNQQFLGRPSRWRQTEKNHWRSRPPSQASFQCSLDCVWLAFVWRTLQQLLFVYIYTSWPKKRNAFKLNPKFNAPHCPNLPIPPNQHISGACTTMSFSAEKLHSKAKSGW